MRKFTVKRSEWLRGTGDGWLFHSGKRCCLGFLGKSCGLTDCAMLGKLSPRSFPEAFPTQLLEQWNRIGEVAYYSDSLQANIIMRINDDETIDDATRERKLIAEFALIGLEPEFVE